jgi:hypothetical protein
VVAPKDKKGNKGSLALAVDTINEQSLKAQWGVADSVLNDPENADLKALLDKIMADKEQGIDYAAADMAAMVKQTNWARKHTSNWMDIQKSRGEKDPAIWEATVGNEALKIKNEFIAAGANIDDATARDYAEKMIYGSGWNPNNGSYEVYDDAWKTRAIASGIDLTKTKTLGGVSMYDLRGKAEDTANAMYTLAYNYGIDSSMSNTAFTSWFENSFRGVMDGTLSAQDVDDELQTMAISRNPGFASQIQRGISLRDAADPYLKVIADTLGYDQDQIDLNDDLVQKVLNNVDEAGNLKPMSLYDAKIAARKDDRWQYTETAKKEYTDMASTILKDFGFEG